MFNADTSSMNSVESISSATTRSSTPRIDYKTCCFLYCKERNSKNDRKLILVASDKR